MQWRAGLSKAGEQLLSLIEHAVFSSEYDQSLRGVLRNRRDVEYLLSIAPLEVLVSDIDESLTEDAKQAEDKSNLPPGGDDDDGGDDSGGIGGGDGGGAPTDNLPEAVRVEVARLSKQSGDKGEQMSALVHLCWRKIDTHAVLIQEPLDAGSLTDRLKDSEVNKLRSEDQPQDETQRRFVALVYDLKCAAEASSHPATRLPPLRGNGEHLKTVLRAAIDAGDETGGNLIRERDLYMVFDGSRPGEYYDSVL